MSRCKRESWRASAFPGPRRGFWGSWAPCVRRAHCPRLRGRFLGFRINPLMRINEATLGVNPFPELAQALRLARLMRRRS